MDNNICYIIGAVASVGSVSKRDGDMIIAADAGYNNLHGAKADLVIGDFDSLGFVPANEKTEVFPERKDYTDTMLAAVEGLKRGYRTFVLLGGIGGRLDHTVANLQTCAYIAEHGGICVAVGDGEAACVIRGGGALRFSSDAKGYISLFSLGNAVRGVTTFGLDYPCHGITLECTFPLGVSNRFTEAQAGVSVDDGYLLVIWQGDASLLVSADAGTAKP